MTPTGAIAAALIIAALAFAGHAATRVAMRLGWKPAPCRGRSRRVGGTTGCGFCVRGRAE